jgi:hypothetical protein
MCVVLLHLAFGRLGPGKSYLERRWGCPIQSRSLERRLGAVRRVCGTYVEFEGLEKEKVGAIAEHVFAEVFFLKMRI